jgi:hypothetical protein
MQFFKNFFIVVGYSAKDFLVLSATALKNFSTVAYSAKKYKTAIFRPKPSRCWIFGLVPKSPTQYSYRSDLCKTPEPNISSLGPFKII